MRSMCEEVSKAMTKQAETIERAAAWRAAVDAGHTIELDCPPGFPRPGDLIDGVVAGTLIEEAARAQHPTPFFGNAMWVFEGVSEADWALVQRTTEPRIKALYNEGLIRYGSW